MRLTLDGSVTIVIAPSESLQLFLNHLCRKDWQIMATLQNILDATKQQKTVVESVVVLLNGLKQQISEGVSGLTAEQQQQVDDIFAAVNSNTQQAADALVTNTPNA